MPSGTEDPELKDFIEFIGEAKGLTGGDEPLNFSPQNPSRKLKDLKARGTFGAITFFRDSSQDILLLKKDYPSRNKPEKRKQFVRQGTEVSDKEHLDTVEPMPAAAAPPKLPKPLLQQNTLNVSKQPY